MGRSKQPEKYVESEEEDGEDLGPWTRVESLKPAGDIWVDPEAPTAQPSWEVPHGETGESAEDKDASSTELYAAGEVWEELIVYKKSIIKPSDINQGGLGDCWFLSAIAALSEEPKRVRSLFLNNMAHDDGGFRIKFYKSGREVVVSVDDQLYFNEEDDLFYASIKGNEMWVPLLEKAYAKLHGSYAALSGGWPEEAMEDLTGCPGKCYEIADFEGDLWASILSWHAEGYLLCCSTGTVKKKKAKGIVDMHAYTMLTAQEAHGFKLVHIRNPWGEGEWKGAWSDNSPLWDQYPDIKRELYDVNADDGVFWMAFEDFVKVYETVHVGFVTESARGRLPAAFDEATETLSFSLTVADADTVFVQAHQEDPRMEGSREDTLALRVTIEDAAEEEVFTNESEAGDRSVLMIATDLQPGEYTVYVEAVDGCPEDDRRFVLTAHSSEKGVKVDGPFENDSEDDEDEEDEEED